MQLNKNSKIFVAGHKGMVGSSIVRYLKKKKYKNILTADKKDLDLLDQLNTQKFLMKKTMRLEKLQAAHLDQV